ELRFDVVLIGLETVIKADQDYIKAQFPAKQEKKADTRKQADA
ncbi:hypothetical protein GGI1_13194, partial [Acidithiobacillus sp. GGI-221]